MDYDNSRHGVGHIYIFSRTPGSKKMEISGKLGIASLNNPAYLYNERMNFIFGLLQVLVLMATIYVSIFKPWRPKRKQSY